VVENQPLLPFGVVENPPLIGFLPRKSEKVVEIEAAFGKKVVENRPYSCLP
jgi:hypothetical protein